MGAAVFTTGLYIDMVLSLNTPTTSTLEDGALGGCHWDIAHTNRIKSAEQWLQEADTRGWHTGLGSLRDRVNSLNPVTKLTEDQWTGSTPVSTAKQSYLLLFLDGDSYSVRPPSIHGSGAQISD
ncbi:hypothetical protein RU639_012456 [Aspergillus parasiticus]